MPPRRIGRSALRREPLGLRDARPAALLLRVDQRSAQQERDDLHGDDVEHDRREDLVDTEVGLERSGDRPPDAAADHPGDEHAAGAGSVAGRSPRPSAAIVAEQSAEQDLTLAADVDHPGPEGDADAGADEQQRRRLDRRVGEFGAPAERPGEQGLVALPRRRPEQPDHQCADGERTERGDHGTAAPLSRLHVR